MTAKKGVHMGCHVVLGATGIIHAMRCIEHAEAKGYDSGKTFTMQGKRVSVWLRGHYLENHK